MNNPQPIIGAIKIKDGLFIGDQFAAQDIEFVVANKVTHVINCAGLTIGNFFESVGIMYLAFPWTESDKEILFDENDEIISEIVKFIDEASEAGESTLVHSVKGQSRSCCVLAAYFMKKFKWGLLKTLEFLNSRRPDLEIRSSFFHQLTQLERKLAASNQNIQNAWGDQGQNAVNAEELIIRNTYLNSRNGPVADIFMDEKAQAAAIRLIKRDKIVWNEENINHFPHQETFNPIFYYKLAQSKSKQKRSCIKGSRVRHTRGNSEGHAINTSNVFTKNIQRSQSGKQIGNSAVQAKQISLHTANSHDNNSSKLQGNNLLNTQTNHTTMNNNFITNASHAPYQLQPVQQTQNNFITKLQHKYQGENQMHNGVVQQNSPSYPVSSSSKILNDNLHNSFLPSTNSNQNSKTSTINHNNPFNKNDDTSTTSEFTLKKNVDNSKNNNNIPNENPSSFINRSNGNSKIGIKPQLLDNKADIASNAVCSFSFVKSNQQEQQKNLSSQQRETNKNKDNQTISNYDQPKNSNILESNRLILESNNLESYNNSNSKGGINLANSKIPSTIISPSNSNNNNQKGGILSNVNKNAIQYNMKAMPPQSSQMIEKKQQLVQKQQILKQQAVGTIISRSNSAKVLDDKENLEQIANINPNQINQKDNRYSGQAQKIIATNQRSSSLSKSYEQQEEGAERTQVNDKSNRPQTRHSSIDKQNEKKEEIQAQAQISIYQGVQEKSKLLSNTLPPNIQQQVKNSDIPDKNQQQNKQIVIPYYYNNQNLIKSSLNQQQEESNDIELNNKVKKQSYLQNHTYFSNSINQNKSTNNSTTSLINQSNNSIHNNYINNNSSSNNNTIKNNALQLNIGNNQNYLNLVSSDKATSFQKANQQFSYINEVKNPSPRTHNSSDSSNLPTPKLNSNKIEAGKIPIGSSTKAMMGFIKSAERPPLKTRDQNSFQGMNGSNSNINTSLPNNLQTQIMPSSTLKFGNDSLKICNESIVEKLSKISSTSTTNKSPILQNCKPPPLPIKPSSNSSKPPQPLLDKNSKENLYYQQPYSVFQPTLNNFMEFDGKQSKVQSITSKGIKSAITATSTTNISNYRAFSPDILSGQAKAEKQKMFPQTSKHRIRSNSPSNPSAPNNNTYNCSQSSKQQIIFPDYAEGERETNIFSVQDSQFNSCLNALSKPRWKF